MGGITIYIDRIVPFTTAMVGLRQNKSSVVNIKTSEAGKSKSNGHSSKILIINDKVHYAAAMTEDRLTTASTKQEISLAIGNSNDYGGIFLFIVVMTYNEQTTGPARLLSQSTSEPFNAKCLHSIGD